MKRVPLLLSICAIAVMTACGSKEPQSSSGKSGLDLAGMDKAVAPGDDFNQYASGTWLKSTPIPADKSAYGIGMILADETRKRTQSLIQDAGSNPSTSGDSRNI